MWGTLIKKWLGSKTSSKKEPVEFEEKETEEPEDDDFLKKYLKGTKGYKTYKTGQQVGRVLGLWK